MLQGYSQQPETVLEVSLCPSLNQDQITRLFDIVPGLDTCHYDPNTGICLSVCLRLSLCLSLHLSVCFSLCLCLCLRLSLCLLQQLTFLRFVANYYHLFLLKMVSVIFAVFRGVILSHYNCS